MTLTQLWKLVAVSLAISLAPIKILDTSQVSGKLLESRKGTLVVEHIVGVVEDDAGNGRAKDGGYISYKYVQEAKAGDTVHTWVIYDPLSNGVDVFWGRYDVVEK